MRTRLFAPLALTLVAACAAPPTESNPQETRPAQEDRSPAVVSPVLAVASPVPDELASAEPVAVPPPEVAPVDPPPPEVLVAPPVAAPAPAAAPALEDEPPAPPKAKPAAKPAPAPKPEKIEVAKVVEPKPSPAPEPAEPVATGEVPSARASFEASQRRVLALAKADAGDGALQAEVDRLLDYRWLAESSLGGASRYAERCGTRCDEFEASLTELIRLNYLRRVRDSERGTVAYKGQEVRKGGTVAKVDTTVSVEDARGRLQTLAIDYVLHRKGAGWKVRDIYTDGVGLAATYRGEFKKMLDEGGIDLVLERVQGKVAELKGQS
jgi:ABC-type transporter MlaC component